MEIKGYKCFNGDKTNRYGIPFEEGVNYHIDGEIRFGNNGNGFHMCVHLSDVFRYFDTSDNNFCVGEVTCWGDCHLREAPDDFEGYYEMYAFSDMRIDRFMTREDIINKMLESSYNDVRKFLRTFVCTEDEIRLFVAKYHNDVDILSIILYYHYKNTGTYYMEVEDRIEQLNMEMRANGQNNNKGCKRKQLKEYRP